MQTRRTIGAACATAVLTALAACSAAGDQTPQSEHTTAAAPGLSLPPSITPSPRPDRPVTIAFGGDVHFEGSSAQALTGGMAPITPLLRRADLAMVNLETAITNRGTPENKDFTFRAPPSAFSALRQAGVDVVTQANNHGVDYGAVGLQDSLVAAKAAEFPVVGIGRDRAAAFRPWETTVRGQHVAVIGATQVLDSNLVGSWTATPDHAGLASAYDVPRLLTAVRKARRTADIVVVYLHWGSELNACPITRQRDLAPALVRAGADVVVGSHAHVLLGAGYLGTSYVSYGLGNFVFYARGGVTSQSGVLTLTVKRHSVEDAAWSPAVIQSGVPVPLSGTAATSATKLWRSLRGCTGLTARPQAL